MAAQSPPIEAANARRADKRLMLTDLRRATAVIARFLASLFLVERRMSKTFFL